MLLCVDIYWLVKNYKEIENKNKGWFIFILFEGYNISDSFLCCF